MPAGVSNPLLRARGQRVTGRAWVAQRAPRSVTRKASALSLGCWYRRQFLGGEEVLLHMRESWLPQVPPSSPRQCTQLAPTLGKQGEASSREGLNADTGALGCQTPCPVPSVAVGQLFALLGCHTRTARPPGAGHWGLVGPVQFPVRRGQGGAAAGLPGQPVRRGVETFLGLSPRPVKGRATARLSRLWLPAERPWEFVLELRPSQQLPMPTSSGL